MPVYSSVVGTIAASLTWTDILSMSTANTHEACFFYKMDTEGDVRGLAGLNASDTSIDFVVDTTPISHAVGESVAYTYPYSYPRVKLQAKSDHDSAAYTCWGYVPERGSC